MTENLSDHKRLAQKFLLRLIWEYEQAMRAAHYSLEMHAALKARCILRDALADKIEHSDVEKHRAALREADSKLYRTSDIEAAYGPRRKRCVECGKNWADHPSQLCPGCAAYREHQR
jgi:predicted amidophosphoribosyltransferase